MPFSKVFSRVNPTFQTPVNATIFTCVFCVLYGLIYVGSTTAFNSFIATAILFLNVTYALPQGVVLLRGRKMTLPARSFDLGAFGAFANAFSVLWVALFTVIFCFPVFRPVTVVTMNYVSVIIGGVGVFIALLWFTRKRHEFTGPNIEGIDGLEVVRTIGSSAAVDIKSESGKTAGQQDAKTIDSGDSR